MEPHERPTSEWEHSHVLAEGDRVHDTDRGVPGIVDSVRENGSVLIAWEDGAETHTETEVTTALADGLIEREDGLSDELASY